MLYFAGRYGKPQNVDQRQKRCNQCFVGVGTFALRVWIDVSLLFVYILFVSRSITPRWYCLACDDASASNKKMCFQTENIHIPPSMAGSHRRTAALTHTRASTLTLVHCGAMRRRSRRSLPLFVLCAHKAFMFDSYPLSTYTRKTTHGIRPDNENDGQYIYLHDLRLNWLSPPNTVRLLWRVFRLKSAAGRMIYTMRHMCVGRRGEKHTNFFDHRNE